MVSRSEPASCPGSPGSPLSPLSPLSPGAPSWPSAPSAPGGPCSPFSPGGPCSPSAPGGPSGPSGPTRESSQSSTEPSKPSSTAISYALRPSIPGAPRSEEHTSELQSRGHIVCRLLLETKKKTRKPPSVALDQVERCTVAPDYNHRL